MPKIWIDIITPKQVMFFNRFIKILQEKNYKLLVPSRDYYELNQMRDDPMEILSQVIFDFLNKRSKN